MTNTLTAPPLRALALLERAHAYAKKNKAQNTLDAYKSLWKDFLDFAARMHADALPASPGLVVAHISELADKQSTSTLSSRLSAIRHYHEQDRLPDPTRDASVRAVLGGIKREHGKPPARKKAIDRDILKDLLRVHPQTMRGARNRAILLVGYACDLRRSELVALTVRDVEFLKDRMVVTVARSKTDQTGAGYALNVPRVANKQLCAVYALELWLRIGVITSGALFREVDRWENVRAKD